MFQQLLYFQKGLGQPDSIVGVGENTVAQPVNTYHKRQPQIAHLHLPVQGSQWQDASTMGSASSKRFTVG